jgi:hypothetical protein
MVLYIYFFPTTFQEHDDLQLTGGKDPDIILKNPSESKGGVAQKLIKVQAQFMAPYLKTVH